MGEEMAQNAGTPASGNPFEQQRALLAGRAVAILDRGIVTVSGPDRLSWLDSITSQQLGLLAPGASAETLLLDPNGRIEHVMRVVDDGEAAWLIVDEGDAPALAAWLDRMRFMLRVEVADRSADFGVVGFVPLRSLSEPGAPPPLRSLSEPGGRVEGRVTWHDPWGAGIQPGGWQYSTAADHPAADWSWSEAVVAREHLGELGEAVPAAAAEALRIAAWRPAFSREVDERSIPHELDWLRSAVHLDKGCYRGQETVAKVHNLGHPPRRLVFLHVDGSDHELPEHGDEVVLAGTDDVIGRVTSGGNHWELGPIALAVVKRSVDPAATLEIVYDRSASDGTKGRLAASQEVVVPPDAGATADVPRIPRLGSVRR
ncbi:MAG TPA: glycine cleavage T C-terminal barrel domain-containing protein [Microbacteriaceae bacterium]|nr:glycine cleavage T C-terminal barrel domain-containing protein [Microbacteriaceae bacterium]